MAMRVVIFGSTGMVGQGVLREALLDPTERVGRAMLNVARAGFDKPVLESADINRAAEQ